MNERYFNSIEDFPLFNWRKCQEKSELKYTRLDINEGTEEEDIEAWRVLLDNFYLEFGISKDYLRLLEIQSEIAELKCDLVITDDRFLLNRIKQLERELEELIGRPVESDTDTCLIYLGKWVGYAVKERDTSVKMFYKLMKEYKAEADRVKKASK